MSHLAIYLLALAALRPASALGVGLQDLASLPKYQVDFLNDLPLAESDAAAIRKHGLSHEDQFLALHPGRQPERSTIEGRDSEESTDLLTTDELTPVAPADRIALIPMLYTHPASPDLGPHPYLCALPSANTTAAQTAVEEPEDEPIPDPESSWRALSHLDGQCLYLRLPHSWFTYACVPSSLPC
jgi:protein OS-9